MHKLPWQVVLVVLLAGCSIPGVAAGPTPSPTPNVVAIVHRLMDCVHTHGAPDFPDPTIGSDGLPHWPESTTKPPDSVIQACQSIYNELPGAARVGAPTQADLDNLRGFARCMRENGFPDWPDPKADGSFPLPPDIAAQGKSPKLIDAWRNHCSQFHVDRINASATGG